MTKVMLQVNFDLDFNVNEDREATTRRAEKHSANMPGLIWKLWLRDEISNRGGGFYLFEDRASAEAFGRGRFETMSDRMPWTKNVRWEYIAVDEELSVITRAIKPV